MMESFYNNKVLCGIYLVEADSTRDMNIYRIRLSTRYASENRFPVRVNWRVHRKGPRT